MYDINYLSLLDKSTFKDVLLKNTYLLKRSEVRDLLMEDRNHYAFVWLVQELKDLSLLFDDDMIDRVINDKKSVDKVIAVFSSVNPSIKSFLSDKLLDYLFSLTKTSGYAANCINDIEYLDINSSKIVFDYMERTGNLGYFSYLSKEAQEALSSDDNILKLLNVELNDRFFLFINKNILDKLFFYSKFREYVINRDINFCDQMVINGTVFPKSITDDERLKYKYLDVQDVSSYRMYISHLEKNNGLFASEIETLRIRDYDYNFKEYDVNGYMPLSSAIKNRIQKNMSIESLVSCDRVLYSAFGEGKFRGNDYDSLLQKYDNLYFKDMIIDRFFHDVPFNFLKNIDSLIKYEKKDVIPSRRMDIYNKLYNFDGLKKEDKCSLYRELLKYPNIQEDFYDDYRACRDNSYSDIKKTTIDFERDINLLSNEMSSRYGVPVFALDGSDFGAFIHNTSFSKKNIRVGDEVWNHNHLDGVSLSYISEKNINTFHDPHESIVLGFSDLEVQRIVHVYASDSFSRYDSLYNEDATNFVNKIYTPEKLVAETTGYNEIIYQNASKYLDIPKLMPSYVVCYDSITDGDVLVAKNFNVPIVVLNTKKYHYANNGLGSLDDRYIDDINGLYQNQSERRL